MNENEISLHVREEILAIIAQITHIKMVVIESRPLYINHNNVRQASQILKGKRFEIAVGLESVNNRIRNVYLNKGISLYQFERAVEIVNRYAFPRAYILLKPPFISEKEAINEAIRSINYAFNIGVQTISLEPATIQKGTLLEYLLLQNQYSPPKLWSIVEVLRKTAPLGKLIVGMFQFYPSPIKVPYNCPKCSDHVLAYLQNYNQTLIPGALDELPLCSCYDEWCTALSNSHSNIRSGLL